jgi:formylmethanofuran dehydrogenase subunit E
MASPQLLQVHPALEEYLARSASRHSHLCPRQVLGVRAALAGAGMLGLDLPRQDKRLIVILETDGCFADGVEVVTGATIGQRTLRLEDYGKIAATFVDARSERAVRLAPAANVRAIAGEICPEERRAYFAQLKAYQLLPADALFSFQEVQLNTTLKAVISRAGVRARCESCGEEIINEREIIRDGHTLCRACAGDAYYSLTC